MRLQNLRGWSGYLRIAAEMRKNTTPHPNRSKGTGKKLSPTPRWLLLRRKVHVEREGCLVPEHESAAAEGGSRATRDTCVRLFWAGTHWRGWPRDGRETPPDEQAAARRLRHGGRAEEKRAGGRAATAHMLVQLCNNQCTTPHGRFGRIAKKRLSAGEHAQNRY
jgi:hypothetical protein